MPQGADLLAVDSQYTTVKEFDVGSRIACHLRDDPHRRRALNLIPVRLPDNRTLSGRGALVPFKRDVVPAGFGVILNPVVNGWTADKIESVLLQANQNYIADQVSVVVAHNELLALIDVESFEAVDPEVGKQLERTGSFNIHVGHVITLVVKNAGALPGLLLVPPVRVLGGYDRVNVWSRLR